MAELEAIQLDVRDLAAQELVGAVLKNPRFDWANAIAAHTVELPKWITSAMMRAVIPKEVRSRHENDAAYYNASANREKATYAWKCISEWDFECTAESLGAPLYEAFALTVMRRLVIGGVYRALPGDAARAEQLRGIEVADTSRGLVTLVCPEPPHELAFAWTKASLAVFCGRSCYTG